MKRIILAATGVIGLGASYALAADLPVKSVPVPSPVYNWTGIYVGGHIGFGFDTIDSTAISGGGAFPPGFTFLKESDFGFLGGGQIGFNYQVAQWVFGLEGDISWTDDIKGTTTTQAPIVPRFVTSKFDIKWTSTATGKLGYAWNNLLLYGKAGVAWADLGGSNATFDSNTLVQTSFVSTNTTTLSGWTAGGGIEWGFANNWSTRVEYNYMDFGTKRITTIDNLGIVLVRDRMIKLDEVKFGVNYRFAVGTY
jgi:outer membrane immunogenic protein